MDVAARALYRSRQFLGALRPRIDAGLRDTAFRLLREPERRLFLSMTLRDQQHGLDVYGRLRAQGHDDRDLLVAALLHDVGKGRIALWHRVAYVLLAAATPGLLSRLAVSTGGTRGAPGWRDALHRCRRHPELGAALAREAGSAAAVVALIRGEGGAGLTEGLAERLAALQAADEA